MKIRSPLTLIILLTTIASFCQQPSSISLDRIQFSIFPGQPTVEGNQGFPEYFDSAHFMKNVTDSIKAFTKKYLGCDSFSLDKDYDVYLFLNKYPTRLRPYKPKRTPEGCYKMSLTTSLDYMPYEDSAMFQISSEIFLTDDHGKVYTERRNTIPFTILSNAAITTSDTLISGADFEQLYFDNLRATFQGRQSVTEYHEYVQPEAHRYDNFLRNTTGFYSYVENDTYFLMRFDSVSYPLYDYKLIQSTQWTDNMFTRLISGDTVRLTNTKTAAVTNMVLDGKQIFDYVFQSYSTLVSATLTSNDSTIGSFGFFVVLY